MTWDRSSKTTSVATGGLDTLREDMEARVRDAVLPVRAEPQREHVQLGRRLWPANWALRRTRCWCWIWADSIHPLEQIIESIGRALDMRTAGAGGLGWWQLRSARKMGEVTENTGCLLRTWCKRWLASLPWARASVACSAQFPQHSIWYRGVVLWRRVQTASAPSF